MREVCRIEYTHTHNYTDTHMLTRSHNNTLMQDVRTHTLTHDTDSRTPQNNDLNCHMSRKLTVVVVAMVVIATLVCVVRYACVCMCVCVCLCLCDPYSGCVAHYIVCGTRAHGHTQIIAGFVYHQFSIRMAEQQSLRARTAAKYLRLDKV